MIDPGTAQRSPNAGRSPEKLCLRHLAARANPRSGPFGLAWRAGTEQGRLRKPASGEFRLSVLGGQLRKWNWDKGMRSHLNQLGAADMHVAAGSSVDVAHVGDNFSERTLRGAAALFVQGYSCAATPPARPNNTPLCKIATVTCAAAAREG
jgi:hypothetical protein